ncbi:ATPase, partial [Pelomonas sp. HMWF004]
MANGDQLKALFRSYAEGDERHFYSVAMQMAAHEAKQGHGKLAEELRDLLDAAKSRRSSGAPEGAIPLARPKGELASLLTVSYPSRRLSDMVLAPPVLAGLQRVLKEQRHLSKLRSHGLHPRRKLLLVGPSGTGKTMTAAALAGELGIPLFVVRLDALITKFMGESAAKLRQVFDAVASTRGVYFFDEFDAIGSQRGMANDVGEIRRILNSFLLMIEQDESSSVI